jgi:hypothetical protein
VLIYLAFWGKRHFGGRESDNQFFSASKRHGLAAFILYIYDNRALFAWVAYVDMVMRKESWLKFCCLCRLCLCDEKLRESAGKVDFLIVPNQMIRMIVGF